MKERIQPPLEKVHAVQMKYLLDTGICIYIIKKKPAPVRDRFARENPGSIAVSSLSIAELYYGAEKSSFPEWNMVAIQKFLQPLVPIGFNVDDTIHCGEARAELEKKGSPIGAIDLHIASQALSHDLTLVTNNTRELSRIKDLRVENWAIV